MCIQTRVEIEFVCREDATEHASSSCCCCYFVGVVGVVVELKSVKTGKGISFVEGSVGNVVSAVVVTLV